MTQMAQMETLIMSLQQQIQNSNQTQDPPRRRRGQKYCWTHGACTHNGADCKTKAQNHIDMATFKNRRGGSNKGCKEWRCGTEVKNKNINSEKLLVSNLTSVVPPQQTNQSIAASTTIAKADSGASKHYFKEKDSEHLQQCTQAPGPTVHLPNGETITSIKHGFLTNCSKLSKAAKKAHIFRDLHTASLISLGQLCDDNCQVFLDKDRLIVLKHQEVIVVGHRNHNDGLWDIPLGSSPQFEASTYTANQKANVIITKDKTKTDIMAYLHACCFSPPKSTFIKAITNGNFLSWSGLTTSNSQNTCMHR